MKWRLGLGLYTAFILTVFLLAYLRFIPTQLNAVPYYDSIGHFVLYGTWGYFFARVFNRIVLRFDWIRVQFGILIIIPIATLEESLQSLSPVRTFSLFDLGWGCLGIMIACLIISMQEKTVRL
jgi:hypothetical protein